MKMPTLSFGGGSHLGVPCRGAFLGRVERLGGNICSDQYPKTLEYLEGGNQVSPKSDARNWMPFIDYVQNIDFRNVPLMLVRFCIKE